MEMYEAEILIENHYMRSRQSWEIARFVSFITAKCAGNAKLKIQDLIKFPWEKEGNLSTEPMTDEQMEQMRARARYIIENNLLD